MVPHDLGVFRPGFSEKAGKFPPARLALHRGFRHGFSFTPATPRRMRLPAGE